ncbi:MAG: protein translocase subunit SecF [Christensenellales bacterium]|jgi:preprotein translocase subunit SecF
MNRRFTGKTGIFLAVSGVIILVALVMQILGFGINLGIDFTGGSLLTYSVGESFDVADVNQILDQAGYSNYLVTKTEPADASAQDGEGDGLTDLQVRLSLVDETEGLEDAVVGAVTEAVDGASLVSYGALSNARINREKYDSAFSGGYIAEFDVNAPFDEAELGDRVSAALTNAGFSVKAVEAVLADADEDAADTGAPLRLLISVENQTGKVREMIEREMSAKYPNFAFVAIDHVSAIAGRDLIANAVKALLIAFACMLVYIAIRFDFYSGVVAMAALIHDALIMCAFMVFFRNVFQANSAFIAALLTIIGYSINNTIIIFDRVREVSKKPGYTQAPKIDVVEYSVGVTLSRTLNTSITTLIALVFLFIFGVDSIREFMFPLIVGMLSGVYASVFLNSQVWAMWMDRRSANKQEKAAAQKGAKA